MKPRRFITMVNNHEKTDASETFQKASKIKIDSFYCQTMEKAFYIWFKSMILTNGRFI